MFVVYGYCTFTSNGQRNSASNSVTSYATSHGLTGYSYAGVSGEPPVPTTFGPGVVNATIGGKPSFRFAYSTPSIATAEAAEAAAQTALDAQNYDGQIAHAEVLAFGK